MTRPQHDQDQFLTVIDRDEAERRFQAALVLTPRESESIPLAEALGRVAAEKVLAPVDVPAFDRSNVDGFAVRAADTFEASEERPRQLTLGGEVLSPGVQPAASVGPGAAVAIATGGMLPRGADAVVMIEHCDVAAGKLLVRRAVTPGANVSFAGTDLTAGEIVVRPSELLTSRETGVLAAVGVARVPVWRRPRVAIVSTGDELLAPGEPMRPGCVYDSNAQVLSDAVRELGGEPVPLGIVRDDLAELRAKLQASLAACDLVLFSGGTSKGAGDLSYRALSELCEPGILCHGVALKPGKPICLAAHQGKAVVILPGFPTSAIFTFHEFVAPVLRRLSGRGTAERATASATMAVKVNSEIGRTEYLLVNLIEEHSRHAPCAVGDNGTRRVPATLLAYPMGKGSGSVTAFSRADGFVTIGRHEEIVEAGAAVEVTLLGRELASADFVVIGSHCIGLDYLLGRMHDRGWRVKFLAVGSTGGLAAARRGECDLAGVHLLDPASGEYNRPYVTPEMELIPGYARQQGIVFRPGDRRFEGKLLADAIAAALVDPSCVMVNRNSGSGTRVLLDQLLAGRQPPGYAVQPKNHHAVAAAVGQGRADWGVTLDHIARRAGLGFLPLRAEQFDFLVPRARRSRPAIADFLALLAEPETAAQLRSLGLHA